MSDAPPQLPPKKEVALTLLEGPSLFVHLDPRRAGVLVPKWFAGQSQLVLQVGLNMAIPIPDLKLDDAGITCTLSFNKAPFWCRLPWPSIYALVGEDGRGMVWPDDVPPEVAQQMQRSQASSARSAPGKRPRAKLAAVESSDDESAPRRRGREDPRPSSSGLRPSESNADEAASARALTPSEQGATAPGGPAQEPKRLEAVSPGPRAHRAPASRGEDETNKPAVSPAASDGPAAKPGGAPAPAGGKRPKRELPPYLRVIK
jgi:stringent starvation protein B